LRKQLSEEALSLLVFFPGKKEIVQLIDYYVFETQSVANEERPRR